MSLLPPLEHSEARAAVGFPDCSLEREALEQAAAALRARLPPDGPLALWAAPHSATVIGLVAALRAGHRVVPIDIKTGPAEIERIVEVSRPGALIAPPGVTVPGLETISPTPGERADPGVEADRSEDAGLIVFTSGTTGPAKGVLLSAAAIAANLDALAHAWQWTAADVLVHALPLFHVHGLVVATLGSLRRGSEVRHLGGFDPAEVAAALGADATMLFAVPTMYHRLAGAAAADPQLAGGLRGARLLVSGSAALAASEHARIEQLCGQRIVERYGMTETLMIASVSADVARAALAPDGYLRLVGRRSTDLIKSGGFRIGAGEIESALLEHPAVAEVAVLGVADADLGERIVAWVVPRPGEAAAEGELIDHVASALTPHKRPREIRFVDSLPRNALGKVQKRMLVGPHHP